ncbi:MAG TPA: rhomboid family intramembrane serine protease [Steroidobacteraceae bacterium]|nr:rhomboid family intramembrane serine protease [Steroidobacteraceae bacterium]
MKTHDADPTPPVEPAAPGRWAIRFLTSSQRTAWSKTPSSRWRWTGKGTLAIGTAGIQLQGLRHRFMWLPAKQQVELTSAQIRNVAVTGRIVRFEAEAAAAAGKLEPVRFAAANAAAARAIAEALPPTCTPEFARIKAEQEAFANALQQLGTRPWVTWALVAANVLVYLAAASHGAGWLVAEPVTLIHWGTNYGPATLSGEWWRLFTSMFLHFGLMHIALNMWALAALGPRIERLFGSWCYALLYLFAGLSGSLASIWWDPGVNSAGASGAIFGLIGGWLAFVLNPATRLPASITGSQRASAFAFILYNLMYGVGHQGIDNACHIGGLIGGILMGWLLAQPLDSEARREQPQRLARGIALGAVALIALAWPLARRPHLSAAEVAFRVDILWFGTQETEAVDRTRELASRYKQHQITDHAWGNELATTVIPTWQAMEARLNVDTLPSSSSLNPLRQALLTYVDSRRQALEFFSKAALTNNAWDNQRGQKFMAQSNDQAAQVRQLLAEVH